MQRPNDTTTETRSYLLLCAKLLLAAFVCPPGCDFSFSYRQSDTPVEYTWDDICAIVSVLRAYAVLPLVKHLYRHVYPSAATMRRIANLSASSSETRFAIIACIKEYPHFVLPLALGSAVVLFASAVQIAERPINDRFSFYGNSLWFLIVSMATSMRFLHSGRVVGYGDITAKTGLGQAISCVAIVYGVCIISLYVVAFGEFLSLSRDEQKAFDDIKAADQEAIHPRMVIVTMLRLLISKWWARKLNPKEVCIREEGRQARRNLQESRRRADRALDMLARDGSSYAELCVI